MFDDPANFALVNFMKDMGTALVNGRRHRHMSQTTQEFFMTVMQYGGPMFHDFVSKVFLGPDRAYNTDVQGSISLPVYSGTF